MELKDRKILVELLSRRHTGKAIEVLNLHLQKDDEDAEIHELLGLTYHIRGEIDQALYSFEIASLLSPLDLSAQLAMADCYLQRGKYELAEMMYEHLLRMSSIPCDFYPEIVTGFQKMNNDQGALRACRIAVEKQPECDKAIFGLAFCKARCGYPFESVIALVRQAISLSPDSLGYRIVAANLCDLVDHREEAISFLESIEQSQVLRVSCPDCVSSLKSIATKLDLYELVQLCEQRLAATS